MKKIDMSSQAITRRLRQTDQLRELSLSLMKAKKISPERLKELQQAKAQKQAASASENQVAE